MRQYNATTSRRDHLTCNYGCCQSHKNMRDDKHRRRAKKAARQEGKREARQSVQADMTPEEQRDALVAWMDQHASE